MEKSLRYNEGKPKWGLVDFKSLLPLVEVMQYGEHKYSVFEDESGNRIKGADISVEDALKLKLISSGKDNWKIDLNPMEIMESTMRHLISLMDNEFMDSESKLKHTGHCMANLLFLEFHLNKNNIYL